MYMHSQLSFYTFFNMFCSYYIVFYLNYSPYQIHNSKQRGLSGVIDAKIDDLTRAFSDPSGDGNESPIAALNALAGRMCKKVMKTSALGVVTVAFTQHPNSVLAFGVQARSSGHTLVRPAVLVKSTGAKKAGRAYFGQNGLKTAASKIPSASPVVLAPEEFSMPYRTAHAYHVLGLPYYLGGNTIRFSTPPDLSTLDYLPANTLVTAQNYYQVARHFDAGVISPWHIRHYYSKGYYDANQQLANLELCAINATHAIIKAADTGFLHRSEIGVSGVFEDENSLAQKITAALKFELLNLVAYPTETLVRYSSGHMATVFTLAKATIQALQSAYDMAQRHALLSYLTHLLLLGQGLFAGKTDSYAALSSFTAMHRYHGAFWLPVPPTLVLVQLGICTVPRTVVFKASHGNCHSKPGVEEKRQFWESKLEEYHSRPICAKCGRVFRNSDLLLEHLAMFRNHNVPGVHSLLKNVSNRVAVKWAISDLDESQKEYVRTVLTGAAVLLIAPAGSGKTLALKALIEVLKILLGEYLFSKLIAVTAPSNIQAANVGGRTVNSVCGIGVAEDEVHPEQLLDTFLGNARAKATFENLRLLCIDEVFKMQKILFDFLVLAMLRCCKKETNNPYEVSRLIL